MAAGQSPAGVTSGQRSDLFAQFAGERFGPKLAPLPSGSPLPACYQQVAEQFDTAAFRWCRQQIGTRPTAVDMPNLGKSGEVFLEDSLPLLQRHLGHSLTGEIDLRFHGREPYLKVDKADLPVVLTGITNDAEIAQYHLFKALAVGISKVIVRKLIDDPEFRTITSGDFVRWLRYADAYSRAAAWGAPGTPRNDTDFTIVKTQIINGDKSLTIATTGYIELLEGILEAATLRWLASVSSWPKDRDLVGTSSESSLHMDWYDRAGEFLATRTLARYAGSPQATMIDKLHSRVIPHANDLVAQLLVA